MKRNLKKLMTLSALALSLGSIPAHACNNDLQVTDISLTPDCKIMVTIRNNGSDELPNSAYTSPGIGVQMYKGAQPWGGMALSVFDPSKQIKQPGGSAQRQWFSASNLQLGLGTHELRVVVDHSNSLLETNESNNSLTRTVQCTKQGTVLDQVNPGLMQKKNTAPTPTKPGFGK